MVEDARFESQVDGSLPAEDWARLTQVSKDVGLYAIGLPEEYGGGGLATWARSSWPSR